MRRRKSLQQIEEKDGAWDEGGRWIIPPAWPSMEQRMPPSCTFSSPVSRVRNSSLHSQCAIMTGASEETRGEGRIGRARNLLLKSGERPVVREDQRELLALQDAECSDAHRGHYAQLNVFKYPKRVSSSQNKGRGSTLWKMRARKVDSPPQQLKGGRGNSSAIDTQQPGE